MEWQQIGEIILAIITAVLGGGGASLHFKHKKHSTGLKDKVEKLDGEVRELDKQLAVIDNTNKFYKKAFEEIQKDIRYIKLKLDGGA